MTGLFLSYSSYRLLLYCWMALAVIVCCVLLRVEAPYGRHASEKWGPSISNRAGWIIMEITVLVTLWVLIAPRKSSLSAVSWIMISLFCLHYIHRSVVFPLQIRTRGKKMPLLVMGSGVFFNIVNGFSLGYYFIHFAHYEFTWLTNSRFICGTILFFSGLLINWKADDMLIGLRKPNQTHYVIPTTWLFEYISCPNLFGELIEWLGFAILCWNLPALSFFIWTAANLLPRAIAHHKWYKNKFTDYPRRRYAIIPFLL